MRDDRGSAAVELVALAATTLALTSLIIYAGRGNIAAIQVDTATRLAARSISMSRDFDAAAVQAEADAAETVDANSPWCEDYTFLPQIDPTADPVTVTVTITCQVDLSEATLITSVPGSVEVSSSATEVVDRYREPIP